MFQILLFFVFGFGFLFGTEGNPLKSFGNAIGGRIVGGTPANIFDYPYQVSVQFEGSHACGGSIIAVSFILTAAHCTYDVTEKQLSVRVGSSFHNSGGQVVQVSKISQHPQFNIDTYDYDIAILKLASSLVLNANVAKINMITATGAIRNGDSAIATGWGRLTNDGVIPAQLQVVTLPTITTQSCQIFYGSGIGGVTDRMFCAGYAAGGKDTCQNLRFPLVGDFQIHSVYVSPTPNRILLKISPIRSVVRDNTLYMSIPKDAGSTKGDSGGPLVLSGTLIGITSWGDICGQANSPGVYTKLSLFRSYVDSVLQS